MVALDVVKASNATIRDELPAGLVAVFVGGTSGIGEITLKLLAKQAVRPKIYIVGRSAEAAARIIAECRTLNPDGEYVFLQKSLTLLKDADALCDEIKQREKHINILFLSIGAPDMSVEKTADGFRPIMAVIGFARHLIAARLLPLIQSAPGLRRIVDVAGAGYEGPIDTSDWQAERITDRNKLRAQLTSIKTIAWLHLAQRAPDVSIITEFPGLVITNLFKRIPGWTGRLFRIAIFLFGWMIAVPLKESAERHVFMATSSAFPPKKGDAKGVQLVQGLETKVGADGELGSGVYSVGWNNDGPGEKVTALLKRYNEDGTASKVWEWMQGEFARVLGAEP